MIFPIFLHCYGARGFECQKSLLRHHTKGRASFFLPSRLFQLPQVHSRQVCLYTYICRQIHTWAYLTINLMGVLFVGTNELHLLWQCLLWSFRSNYSKLQCGPSMMSWSDQTLFVFVNPYHFLLQ